MSDNLKEREAFEAWLPTQYWSSMDPENGAYTRLCTQGAWEAWNARAAIEANTPAVPNAKAQSCVPTDFLSHKEAWRRALVRCKAATTTVADMDYWSHEISTFDAAYEELGASTMPDGQLLRFYGVGDYQTLVAAQAAHIEKLQAKVPRDNIPAFTTAREG